VACLLAHKNKKAANSSGCELGRVRTIFLMVVDENGVGRSQKRSEFFYRRIDTAICIAQNVRITLIGQYS
jgi:hypothetical protein